MQQGTAKPGKADVGPAGDQVIGEADNFLIFPFIADFRATEDYLQCRTRRLELSDDFRGLPNIPDVHPETDDLRCRARFAQLGEQGSDDFIDGSLDGEFAQDTHRPQVAASVTSQVGEQVAQAERGMDVLGVEGSQNNGGRRHVAILPVSP